VLFRWHFWTASRMWYAYLEYERRKAGKNRVFSLMDLFITQDWDTHRLTSRSGFIQIIRSVLPCWRILTIKSLLPLVTNRNDSFLLDK
jgi:hypothetical protein